MTQGAPTVDMGRSSVTDAMIAAYALNGFVKVPNLITAESASALRDEALGVATGTATNGDEWRRRLCRTADPAGQCVAQ